MERIEQLDPKPFEGENEMAKVWEDQARSSPAGEVYEKCLAEIWHETGCDTVCAAWINSSIKIPLNFAFS
jgi:hypothetical protein